ncbi:MAG TPA: hypothetical protein VMU83_21430 [Hanamia sp.]|nr:hypothetical protein [Hanamia sp.]
MKVKFVNSEFIDNCYLYKKLLMPVISMFYGIIIRMFYYDNKEYHIPHIHVLYANTLP